MKTRNLFIGIVLLSSLILSINFISSCLSDIECPGQGQITCQSEDDSFVETEWSCIDSNCVEKFVGIVECCPLSLGCAPDQMCQDSECVGGSATLLIDPTTNRQTNSNSILLGAVIIAIALIIGFIILTKKKKK